MIVIVIALASCSSKSNLPKESIKNVKEVVREKNNDLSMKIEGYSFNLESKLKTSLPLIDNLTSCPVWHNEVKMGESNYKLYNFSESDRNLEEPTPTYVAECDVDSNTGKYVLILAKFSNSDEVAKSVKAAFKDNEGYLYLGLPTSIKLGNNNQLEDFELYKTQVATDDCGISSPELLDTDCPSGNAVFYKIGAYIVILSQRFENDYNGSTYPIDDFKEFYP